MASTRGAEERIDYLLGFAPYRSSPNTISYKWAGRQIQSYALPIGFEGKNGYRDDGRYAQEYWVYDLKSSQTTNRHIRALKNVLERRGYRPTDETQLIDVFRPWSGSYTLRYVKWIKED